MIKSNERDEALEHGLPEMANKVHPNDHWPKVSVIIPVYNTEEYLKRCVDSVIGQTERDLEIICVNDGSTDSSAMILEWYAATDQRVKVITQENGGLSAARNAGLDAATGEYAMFVDSDDWLPSDAVEKMLWVAKASGLSVVVSNGFAKDPLSKSRLVQCAWRIMAPALERFVSNRKIHSSVCNKLYLRETIGSRRFIRGISFEDWPFCTELFADIPAFALVDEPMYVYTTERASITRSAFSRQKAESYLTGIAHVANYFQGRPDASIAARRIAIAIKMLVGKVSKSGDAALRRFVLTQSFSGFPLDLKTRFRLWRMRIKDSLAVCGKRST